MTCVTANNVFPRSIIFLSFRTPGNLTFITFVPGLSDAKMTELREIYGVKTIDWDKFSWKYLENELKIYHNRTTQLNFVWMQDC